MLEESTCWGTLTLAGGSEEAGKPTPPSILHLSSSKVYIGRVPNRQNGGKTAPEKQLVIGSMFISSTHFSIERNVENGTYEITDYSKNGTFLITKANPNSTGTPVGDNKPLKISLIQEGDEVALNYKGVVQLKYRFSLAKQSTDRSSFMDSQVNNSIDVFEQQISVLNEENAALVERLTSKETQLEAVTKDLDLENRKSRSLQGQVQLNEKEIQELNVKVREVEANSHAIEARNCKIQETLEESKSELKETKLKLASLHDDLKHKQSQLDNRQNLMSDVNNALAKEKSHRNQKEAECRRLLSKIEEHSLKISSLNTANENLQQVVTGFEQAYTVAKQKNQSMLSLLTNIVAEEGAKDKLIVDLQTKLGSIVKTLNCVLEKDLEGSLLGLTGSIRRMVGDLDKLELGEVDVYNSLVVQEAKGGGNRDRDEDRDGGTMDQKNAHEDNGHSNEQPRHAPAPAPTPTPLAIASLSMSPPIRFVGPMLGPLAAASSQLGQWEETNISQNGSFANCYMMDHEDGGGYGDMSELGGCTQVPLQEAMVDEDEEEEGGEGKGKVGQEKEDEQERKDMDETRILGDKAVEDDPGNMGDSMGGMRGREGGNGKAVPGSSEVLEVVTNRVEEIEEEEEEELPHKGQHIPDEPLPLAYEEEEGEREGEKERDAIQPVAVDKPAVLFPGPIEEGVEEGMEEGMEEEKGEQEMENKDSNHRDWNHQEAAVRNRNGERDKGRGEGEAEAEEDSQNRNMNRPVNGNGSSGEHSDVIPSVKENLQEQENLLHLIQPVVVDNFVSSQFSDSVVMGDDCKKKRLNRESDVEDSYGDGHFVVDYEGEEETSILVATVGQEDGFMAKKTRY